MKYIYQDPKPSLKTWHQKEYIASYVNAVEEILYSENFTDPVAGYQAYIDVNSFIHYFIVSAISRNVDAYKKSLFSIKIRTEKTPKYIRGQYGITFGHGKTSTIAFFTKILMARVGLIALQPGVYMVKVLLENGQTYTQKIVKN